MEKLRLKRIGKNDLEDVVYTDEISGKYFLDISKNNETENPTELYGSTSNDMDGEPSFLLTVPFEIINPYTDRDVKQNQYKFQYMMLGRLLDDARAFFGLGDENDKYDNRYQRENCIWSRDIKNLVSKMHSLYDEIPNDIKPEWCTLDMIKDYEKQAYNYTLK